ncbi:UNKNOWN [Stylonychia lemnae]|uniref:Uncharacterized protein n=1 Tax=Stylonychia lemnae TaxID=5949 RepID=A0A078ARZ7_STYLE|nr:UNKNOWN [Stylonychia lemnae]|eukprot:CDW83972.1 UNKNOWN [Stylonychia lemnae]
MKRGYNTSNPYNIHSYMNQVGNAELVSFRNEKITMNQSQIYNNPKYQYLLNRMKKKHYSSDRKQTPGAHDFNISEERYFQLNGQRAKLIDNSFLPMMMQYNYAYNIFQNNQINDELQLSEATFTPLANKYPTKVYIKENSKLSPQLGKSRVQKQLEPFTTSSNINQTQTQSFSGQTNIIMPNANHSNNMNRTYGSLIDKQKSQSVVQQATTQLNNHRDISQIILLDDIKSSGGIRSNLSFITANSPQQLSKNASTMMHLQPKLDQSAINIINQNSGSKLQRQIITSKFNNHENRSGVYNLKDMQKVKPSNSGVRKASIYEQKSKLEDFIKIQDLQLRATSIKKEFLSPISNQMPIQILSNYKRQVLPLNKALKKNIVNNDYSNNPCHEVKHLNLDLRSPLQISQILSGKKNDSEYLIRDKHNRRNSEMASNDQQGEDTSTVFHHGGMHQDSAKNSLQHLKMSFNIEINDKELESKNDDFTEKSRMIESQNIDLTGKAGNQHYNNSNFMSQINNNNLDLIDENIQLGEMQFLDNKLTCTEVKKLDKAADNLINKIDDDKYFKEIRQICLRHGLKSYKDKKFIRSSKDVKFTFRNSKQGNKSIY